MRLWSLHPKYLDPQGLVALWRESLLAKKVLEGKTKGYIKHPQLIRFKKHPFPITVINCYLDKIYQESQKRNYKFKKKYSIQFSNFPILTVTRDQINYEFSHLKKKLAIRNLEAYIKITKLKVVEPHPLFTIIPGKIESWEKQTQT